VPPYFKPDSSFCWVRGTFSIHTHLLQVPKEKVIVFIQKTWKKKKALRLPPLFHRNFTRQELEMGN